jgi:putative phage-type endonuclease
MTDIKQIDTDVNEYLQYCNIDFDLPLLENQFQIFNELIILFQIDKTEISEEQECLKYYLKNFLNKELKKLYHYEFSKQKVNELKQLVLPDQRTPEWYEMRKNKLTASSFADALGKGHFKSRDEAILDKIVSTPFVENPITEWGVKYEEVATRFYEYLTGTSIYEFGLIPHPEFPAFGASPDGICDVNSPVEYIGRMLEIKCPPKRKFTKSVPPHYMMQMQGQLEVCDLEECDFLQVKLEEYLNYQDYKSDDLNIPDKFGFTKEDLPKGYSITYVEESDPKKLKYLYCPLFSSNSQIDMWKEDQMKFIEENKFIFKEEKFWKITRYECTLVKRDKEWWSDSVSDIYQFYKDLLYYKKDDNVEILKKKVMEKKSKKPVYHVKEVIDDFCLI